MHVKLKHDFCFLFSPSAFCFPVSFSAIAVESYTFGAEAAEVLGGAAKLADCAAAGGSLLGLHASGEGVKFASLPVASKLEIRHASMGVGTIIVAVNDRRVPFSMRSQRNCLGLRVHISSMSLS